MNFLRALALAHQRHEGWYKGSMSHRNNNPGNLRGKDGQFIHFVTYQAGLSALEYDLRQKISGQANSIKRYIFVTNTQYEKLTMLDYVAIYAPSADNNNPVSYANALCRDLKAYNVKPTSLLTELLKLINGEWQRIPDPPQTKEQILWRIKIASNALKWAKPPRAQVLLRLIKRLWQMIASM